MVKDKKERILQKMFMAKIKQKKQKIITPTLFDTSKKKKNHEFTFIDLFAGVGGTRLGFERAGGECVFTSEWDSSCQKTYQANFGELPYGDITKIKETEIPAFDILIAGFPCQPFSSIGKRQGFMHATQGTLFYDVLRIIKGKKNKAFLLENVGGLVTHDKGNTFKTILEALDKVGYKVFYKILNAANYGVPQHRKRIYIVGFRRDLFKDENIEFEFPEGTNNKDYINKYLEKDVKGYSISTHLQKNYLFKKKDGRPIIVDKNSKFQIKTLVSSYHKIQRLTGTFVKDGETGLRLLTEKECKAIMGFPKNFIIPVSRTQMYRQMGNSVVVPVIEAVAKQMVKTLSKIKK
ncbi:MAG: DNA-cytosine methyltransferase [Parcubacteria group bacterium Gr01-1014_13]|nr:MAG: DNA-cytosine methyltransferase [Parcubacteria group bacterium Gr01-1014_13]